MPRYPGAHWRPIRGHTDGPMRAHLGAVLHVNQSNGNLFHYFDNPANEVSAHFEIYKSGAVEQYLDTTDSSWCQMAGNDSYVSIETEGYVAEPLTAAQLAAAAKLLAWLHEVHGIPLRLAEHPGERGLGWHGMGGAAWGGHTGCPGDKRKAQRAAILHAAGAQHTPTPAPPTGQDWLEMATQQDVENAVVAALESKAGKRAIDVAIAPRLANYFSSVHGDNRPHKLVTWLAAVGLPVKPELNPDRK